MNSVVKSKQDVRELPFRDKRECLLAGILIDFGFVFLFQ